MQEKLTVIQRQAPREAVVAVEFLGNEAAAMLGHMRDMKLVNMMCESEAPEVETQITPKDDTKERIGRHQQEMTEVGVRHLLLRTREGAHEMQVKREWDEISPTGGGVIRVHLLPEPVVEIMMNSGVDEVGAKAEQHELEEREAGVIRERAVQEIASMIMIMTMMNIGVSEVGVNIDQHEQRMPGVGMNQDLLATDMIVVTIGIASLGEGIDD